jgi:hypothetical protein
MRGGIEAKRAEVAAVSRGNSKKRRKKVKLSP